MIYFRIYCHGEDITSLPFFIPKFGLLHVYSFLRLLDDTVRHWSYRATTRGVLTLTVKDYARWHKVSSETE